MLVRLIDLDTSFKLAYNRLFSLLSQLLRMLVTSSIVVSSVITIFYF
jgi:hypothetical protein